MKRVLVVDIEKEKGGTRTKRIITCLGPECIADAVPQVYGAPSLPDAPPGFNEELTLQAKATLNGVDLVILHCGERQHLVPAVLWNDALRDVPCLLYTALPGPPKLVAEYLRGDHVSPGHVAVPVRLYPQLAEEWPQSRDGIALRECVTAIVSGIPPKVAVRSAFGDPDLDKILDGLYEKLMTGPENVDLRAIRNDRNTLLEAHYEKIRGWKDPAFEQGWA